MKIVNMMGGLGNQMFEYAFALSLKERFPGEKVLIDTSHYGHIFFRRFKGANLHNGFEIDKVFPNAFLKIASPRDLLSVTWYMPNYILSRIVRKLLPVRKSELIQPLDKTFIYMPEVYERSGDCYYEGIWESVQNFIPIRNILLHVYAHPDPKDDVNRSYIGQMESEDSVGIHIRRGDYIYEPAFCNICELDYYRRAIAEILKDRKNHTFYIFSNEMAWCQEHILPLLKGNSFFMVTENAGKNSCWDMFLMTHCKDLIIANSSFSWWGAFLNKRNGRIIVPSKWTNRDVEHDIWMDSWIRI